MSWKYVQRDTETGQYRTTDQGGGGGGSSTFAGLDDVSFSNIQNGQVPKYNSTTHKWENADESVNHNVLMAYGQIVKSSNTTVAAIGSATVNLSGNLAEIDFSFKATVGGGSSSDFEWGLSVDQLRLLNPNIPNLKPVQGGNFFCTQSNQSELVGYGTILSPTVPSYKYWLPARIYTTSGDVGAWPSNNLYVNGYWFGRCYAEIVR